MGPTTNNTKNQQTKSCFFLKRHNKCVSNSELTQQTLFIYLVVYMCDGLNENAPMGSYIWMLGLQLADCLKRIKGLIPWGGL